MKKTVVLLSGGIDSTVLLHDYVHQYGRERIRALAFDYGQRSSKELSFAYLNALAVGVPYHAANLSSLGKILCGNALTDRKIPIPDGRGDEEGMKKATVPNRNMVLLSIGLAHAIASGCDTVTYGAHKGGFDLDTRPEFIAAMDQVARLCDWNPLEIQCPYIDLSKADVIKKGIDLGVNYAKTWSCYADQDLHCGRCSACCKRILSFKEAGVKDPTLYADPGYALA